MGITTPGSAVEGGADQYGESLSSDAALGGSTLSWNGQTFNLGPANANDIVSATGQTIPITHGSYTALDLLAMSTGYSESMGGVFEIDYTNGSYDRYTLGVSDWKTGYTGTGGSLAPGESIVASPTTYDTLERNAGRIDRRNRLRLWLRDSGRPEPNTARSRDRQ